MKEKKRDLKRRDKKGRILRNGESQRADGRYAYVYTDCFGKQKFLYSWKLEATDPLPAGCRPCQSLREKEKSVQRDMDDGIIPYGGELTVLQLVTKYVKQKTGVRHNTMANYNFVINVIKKEEFGTRRIDKVKLSDAKEWLIKLQADGRGYSSIHSIRGVVRPAFQMAVDDDLIRKNPFEFQLCTVVVNDSVTREAITRKQERKFLEFIKNDEHYKRYYDGMFVLFKIGLRISEIQGLKFRDFDMGNHTVSIKRQVTSNPIIPKGQSKMETCTVVEKPPKTENSYRTLRVPDVIMDELGRRKIMIEQVKKQMGSSFVDMDYISCQENGAPHAVTAMNNALTKLCSRNALPHITVHGLRHMYATILMEQGVSLVKISALLGHASINTTFEYYCDVMDENEQIISFMNSRFVPEGGE